MRLLPRLTLSISVPLVILTIAMGLIVVSLTRVTRALGELRRGELYSMQSEADLHRAGWGVDVALRQAEVTCEADRTAGRRVASRVAGAARQLERATERYPNAHPRLLRASEEYLRLAAQVERAPDCATVTSAGLQESRTELDEEYTNVWVTRMQGLQDDVVAREAQMQDLVTATLFGVLVLSGIAVGLAVLVSVAMARSITTPLATLTDTARRLGHGELEGRVPEVGGVSELREFASELEAMRGRLAELDSLKQGFIASCSHELRTPLSKLREALALLADGATGPLEPRQLKVVAIARAACERQIHTVSSILDLSRLRAGTPLRLRAGVSPTEVVQDAVEVERSDAQARGVSIALETEGAETARADLDDVLLEHAISNLVRNAVSVSHRGDQVRVVRRIDYPRDGESWLTVEIEDNGPGVPEELAQAIFSPFVTHAPAGSPKRVGVGLGLALAREVAEAHGGELELSQPEDGGTIFRLRLPLRRELTPSRSGLSVAEAAS